MNFQFSIFNFQLRRTVVSFGFGTLLMVASLLSPKHAQAAVLYFSPSGGEKNVGDTFTVDARIDLDGAEECVNVIEGVIGFDRNYLEAIDFGTGDSILSLWLDLPKQSDMPETNRLGRLSFSGGTPGGYCGKIPGDPGASNIVGKLVFKVKKYQPDIAADANAKIFFLDTSRVLLNDGLGTEAEVARKDASFYIADSEAAPTQEWDTLLTADKTPPEPFILEIQQNPELYDGKYYVIFSTTDKQTGVDRYVIQESRHVPDEEPGFWSKLWASLTKTEDEGADWLPVTSSYVLRDQSLSSDIRVKAVDKAGNERIAEYIPKDAVSADSKILIFRPLVLLLIVASLAMGAYLLKRKKAQKKLG